MSMRFATVSIFVVCIFGGVLTGLLTSESGSQTATTGPSHSRSDALESNHAGTATPLKNTRHINKRSEAQDSTKGTFRDSSETKSVVRHGIVSMPQFAESKGRTDKLREYARRVDAFKSQLQVERQSIETLTSLAKKMMDKWVESRGQSPSRLTREKLNIEYGVNKARFERNLRLLNQNAKARSLQKRVSQLNSAALSSERNGNLDLALILNRDAINISNTLANMPGHRRSGERSLDKSVYVRKELNSRFKSRKSVYLQHASLQLSAASLHLILHRIEKLLKPQDGILISSGESDQLKALAKDYEKKKARLMKAVRDFTKLVTDDARIQN